MTTVTELPRSDVPGAHATAPEPGKRPASSGRRRPRSRPDHHARYAGRSLAVVALMVVGLWAAVHGIAGVGWTQVSQVLHVVTPGRLVLLSAVWLGGLVIYATVLDGALPGLGVRRGLLLNLSGSAVANVVPLGGALATAVNWRMVKAWGHSDRSFLAFCILSNGLDVMVKLLLPAVALGTLLLLSAHVPTWLWVVASAGAVGSVVLALATTLLPRLPGQAGRAGGSTLLRHLRGSGDQIRDLVVHRWLRLVSANVAYVAAQVLLLGLALGAVGLHAGVATVLVAAAVERLGTLVPITPGGAGVAEVGTVAVLVAAGQDPAGVVAGVLLYRIFLIILDVPVGGALLGSWWWLHRATEPARAGRVAA